jgi:sigma-B regulation protein RsbU (phosphoserine phosphatase)
MGYLLAGAGELATSDLATDARFPGLRGLTLPARALLAVPLKVDGQVTGMMAASHARPGRDWSHREAQLMTILASHSAGIIEKARLRLEAEGKRRLELEKQALEKELLIAREIQMHLVPAAPLTAGGWQLEGHVLPAQQVGGDLYDYFPLDGGRVGFVLADVSGKGIPAALLVSTLQSALRAFAENGLDPARLVAQLNRTIIRASTGGRFITMFYGELDPTSGRLRYVNAGHVHPRLRCADGRLESLGTGGLPLGFLEDAVFDVAERKLEAGDSILLVSDGIPEATNLLHQEFGEERMDALWARAGESGVTGFLHRLLQEVRVFRGAAPQADDETVLVLTARS